MQKYEEREAVVLENKGLKLFGVLHRPVALSPAPAVLICHGLAGHKVGKYRVYVDLAERLTREGIAVFRVDFRGGGDSEGKFSDVTLTEEVSDALVCLDFLHEHDAIDSDRIGIFGRSFGGAVATMAASQYKKLKSIVLWAPLFNGDQWRHHWEKAQSEGLSQKKKRDLTLINGQLPSMPFYQELFNMRLEDNMHALMAIPLLLIHPENDTIVAVKHSERYAACREDAERETEFIRLPLCDHDFSDYEERQLSIDETVKWFKRTL